MISKILANAGLAFFTTMSGILTADSIIKSNIPFEHILISALVVSSIQAAISFFKEVIAEDKEVANDLKKGRKGMVCWKTKAFSLLDNFVLF